LNEALHHGIQMLLRYGAMIISDSHKFVFIHNPKVAGMTFRLALMQYETRGNPFFEWQWVGHDKTRIDMAHITLQQLRRFFPNEVDQVARYFKFGFVRNPYTRFYSAISQHLKLGAPHTRVAILSDPDLFYRFANAFALEILNEARVASDFRLVHFRRQSEFFYFGDLQWADCILKLEEIDAIAGTPIADWLGNAAGTVKNRTDAFAETGYDLTALTPAARMVIENYYAPDFERFGYVRL